MLWGRFAFGHAFGVRVDGASPRGLWPPAGGRLCSLTLRGRQRLRRCGVRIALRAMLIKSALRDLPFCVIGHEKHYVNQPPPVASPPLWCLSAPPFPRKRGHYKAPLCCEPLMKGLLCRALLSHRSAGGRWWHQPPKGACISDARRAVVWF